MYYLILAISIFCVALLVGEFFEILIFEDKRMIIPNIIAFLCLLGIIGVFMFFIFEIIQR